VRWRLRDADDIAWRCWDGECVVYVVRSATTNLLSPIGRAVLTAWHDRHETLSLEDICGRAFAVAAQPFAEKKELVRDMLLEFERIGVAEPEVS